jgi:hypothetical protein
MGYHRRKIHKGNLGEFSKVREEYEELLDGAEQGNVVLQMVEMADLLGAIELYAAQWNVTLADLIRMKDATRSAFEDGTR